MDAIDGELEFEMVTKSTAAALLTGFDAGKTHFGKQVTEMVTRLRPGLWVPSMRILAFRHEDRTAGVCAWHLKPLPSPDLVLPNDMYIYTLGLCVDYQGSKLSDGTWLSNALLRGALRQMREDDPSGNMPASWAYIGPFNRKSHRLHRQHGYATRKPLPKSDIIRFRPPGLDPDLYLRDSK